MIHNVCALTAVPILDGDPVVLLLPAPGSLGRGGWDRSCPAIDLIDRIVTGGVYHCGWLADMAAPPDGEATLLRVLFVHDQAWRTADRLGSGKDCLARVIDFAVRSGVRLDHAIDLKSSRPEIDRASLLARLDLCDEMARRL